MSLDGQVLLAHVARLHYVRDLPKQAIAERLGVSRFKVARLLDQARAEGVVRFEIADVVAVDDARSRALEERFGLRLAVVADAGDDDAAARAAAAWLPELLDGARRVGVAWGATLARVAELLPDSGARPEPARDVVQICGAVPGLHPGTGPAELAQRFADRLGASLHALPAPALAGRPARDALLADPTVAPTVALFGRLDVAVVGIGTAAALPGAPRGAAGHLLVHVFGADGAPLRGGPGDRAIAAGRADLARSRLVAVAGGARKGAALRGALRTGLVDVVVTDRVGAAAALREDA